MFEKVPPQVLVNMETKNITSNIHIYTVFQDSLEKYAADPALDTNLGEFVTTSTSVDEDGRPFVASNEHRTRPLYGLQYHPEKANFEVNSYEPLVHSNEAKELSSYLGNFFWDKVMEHKRAQNIFWDYENFDHLLAKYRPPHVPKPADSGLAKHFRMVNIAGVGETVPLAYEWVQGWKGEVEPTSPEEQEE